MSNELAVRYEVDGSEITLNPAIVLNYMVDDKTMSKISNKEMAKVIMTCQARKLNPFTGDVIVQPFCNKDGSVTCSLVVTKDFFTRRAERNPRYKGKKAGIVILSQDGRLVKRPGSSTYKELGEKLVGGWCEVYIDGREVPEYSEVSFGEYNTGRAFWNSKPGTMIRKVAVSQALREAFPDDFGGLYEPEEMGVDDAEKTISAVELEESNEAEFVELDPEEEKPQRTGVDPLFLANPFRMKDERDLFEEDF